MCLLVIVIRAGHAMQRSRWHVGGQGHSSRTPWEAPPRYCCLRAARKGRTLCFHQFGPQQGNTLWSLRSLCLSMLPLWTFLSGMFCICGVLKGMVSMCTIRSSLIFSFQPISDLCRLDTKHTKKRNVPRIQLDHYITFTAVRGCTEWLWRCLSSQEPGPGQTLTISCLQSQRVIMWFP